MTFTTIPRPPTPARDTMAATMKAFVYGKVQPSSTVAIVGAGPVGLATLLTAQFLSPAEIVMIDFDDNRLAMAGHFGATTVVNSAGGKAVETVMMMTGNRGVDTAI